jgi:hypothetical protein
MSDPDHTHKWHTGPTRDMLICDGCKTARRLSDVLQDVQSDIALRTKVQVLNGQLFARELKKPAHAAAYRWVVQHAPAITIPVAIPQGKLL